MHFRLEGVVVVVGVVAEVAYLEKIGIKGAPIGTTRIIRDLNGRIKTPLLEQGETEFLTGVAREKTARSAFAVVPEVRLSFARHIPDETLQECLTQKVKGSGTVRSAVKIGESVSTLVAHVRQLKVEMRSELVLNG